MAVVYDAYVLGDALGPLFSTQEKAKVWLKETATNVNHVTRWIPGKPVKEVLVLQQVMEGSDGEHGWINVGYIQKREVL